MTFLNSSVNLQRKVLSLVGMEDEISPEDVVIINYTQLNLPVSTSTIESSDNIYANKYLHYRKPESNKKNMRPRS
jgi:hypothetical protein